VRSDREIQQKIMGYTLSDMTGAMAFMTEAMADDDASRTADVLDFAEDVLQQLCNTVKNHTSDGMEFRVVMFQVALNVIYNALEEFENFSDDTGIDYMKHARKFADSIVIAKVGDAK